jgi:hypothetical protein
VVIKRGRVRGGRKCERRDEMLKEGGSVRGGRECERRR